MNDEIRDPIVASLAVMVDKSVGKLQVRTKALADAHNSLLEEVKELYALTARLEERVATIEKRLDPEQKP